MSNQKLLLIITIGLITISALCGLIIHKHSVLNTYSVGADMYIKNNMKCNIYKEKYIEELQKKENGNTDKVLTEAKLNKCNK